MIRGVLAVTGAGETGVSPEIEKLIWALAVSAYEDGAKQSRVANEKLVEIAAALFQAVARLEQRQQPIVVSSTNKHVS